MHYLFLYVSIVYLLLVVPFHIISRIKRERVRERVSERERVRERESERECVCERESERERGREKEREREREGWRE